MNLDNVVGQLLQGGMSPATQSRVDYAMGQDGLGGLANSGGIGDVLGSMLGGGGSGGGSGGRGGGLGGLLGGIGGALSGDSGIGGMSRGQVGGIGALAGALLGGGGGAVQGALGGGAMALLGTLAVSALKNWQAQDGAAAGDAVQAAVSETEMQRMTAPDTAELCLRGMIEAAKSDGHISQAEKDRLVGELQEGGVTPEERQFVLDHMSRPQDLQGLIDAIPDPQTAAQVYAAALMAITVDTEAERNFLADLAYGTGLEPGTASRLHKLVGAPPPLT